MHRDPVLGAMMREALRRMELAETYSHTANTDGVEFHMALIPEMCPGNSGYLEVARMENGHVAEIINRSGRKALTEFSIGEALEWFQRVRIEWLDAQKEDGSC